MKWGIGQKGKSEFYAKGGSILWANKQLDITNDVVEALNEMYKNEQKKK